MFLLTRVYEDNVGSAWVFHTSLTMWVTGKPPSVKHGILRALFTNRASKSVFWAFIAILAVTLLVITLNGRGAARVVGGALLAGLLVLGLVLRLGSKSETEVEQPTRGRPTSPAAAVRAIPLD